MSNKKSTEDGWWRFIDLCQKTTTRKTFIELLMLFLTHEERDDIAKRYLLIKALLEDKLTQREIAEQYDISISKITRGSNALKIVPDDLRRFLLNHVK